MQLKIYHNIMNAEHLLEYLAITLHTGWGVEF